MWSAHALQLKQQQFSVNEEGNAKQVRKGGWASSKGVGASQSSVTFMRCTRSALQHACVESFRLPLKLAGSTRQTSQINTHRGGSHARTHPHPHQRLPYGCADSIRTVHHPRWCGTHCSSSSCSCGGMLS